jgi:hypothetical protein
MEALELAPARPVTRRELGWAALLTLLVAGLYILVFKIDFSGPLFGFSDTPIWYMAGDFFRTNLHWWPWPHLEPMTERYMYPYGPTVGVYQPFAFERDILVSLAIRVGGGVGAGLLHGLFVHDQSGGAGGMGSVSGGAARGVGRVVGGSAAAGATGVEIFDRGGGGGGVIGGAVLSADPANSGEFGLLRQSAKQSDDALSPAAAICTAVAGGRLFGR